MRRMIFTLAAAITAVIANLVPAPAQAYPVYPWCATYRNGATNCYFATFAQCRAALSGNGGSCYQNPFYGAPGYGGTPASAPRRARRYRRR